MNIDSNPIARGDVTEVDPLLFTLYWNALVAIVEEMGTILQRTAFSDVIREVRGQIADRKELERE